jgi:hypothetical protein
MPPDKTTVVFTPERVTATGMVRSPPFSVGNEQRTIFRHRARSRPLSSAPIHTQDTTGDPAHSTQTSTTLLQLLPREHSHSSAHGRRPPPSSPQYTHYHHAHPWFTTVASALQCWTGTSTLDSGKQERTQHVHYCASNSECCKACPSSRKRELAV